MRKTFVLTEKIVRAVCFGFAALLTAAFFVSCTDEDKNSVREEFIEVYSDPSGNVPTSTLVFGVSGGEQTVYVKSNIDFTVHWENSGTYQWAVIVDDSVVDSSSGMRAITVAVARVSSEILYTKRKGTLIFTPTDPTLNYNEFVLCNQGSVERLGTDFSWLNIGTANPNSDTKTIFNEWSSSQKAYSYSSTPFSGEETAYCYSKLGYVQLGDDAGHGADLITPNTTDFYQDSLLVVSFCAVAYTPYSGQRDSNKLTVEVTGGGVIQDYEEEGSTSISLEVPYYDVYDSEFPDSIWNGTNHLVFVRGTEANPLTTNTKIRFISGSLTETGDTNNRIFLNNLYIYTVGENEENYFLENGGSGLDHILAE